MYFISKVFMKSFIRLVIFCVLAVIISGCTGLKLRREQNKETGKKKGISIILEDRRPILLSDRGGVIPPPYEKPSIAPSSTQLDVQEEQTILIEDVPEISLLTQKEPIIETLAPEQSEEQKLELVPLPIVKTETIKYIVKKGDSFWRIAKMFGVSMHELVAYNHKNLKTILTVGTVLEIPPGGELNPKWNKTKERSKKSIKQNTSPANKSSQLSNPMLNYKPKGKELLPSNGQYHIQKGDSLYKISHRFGISVKKIMSLNDLKSTVIHPGATLVLKESSSAGIKAEPVMDFDSGFEDDALEDGFDDTGIIQKEESPSDLRYFDTKNISSTSTTELGKIKDAAKDIPKSNKIKKENRIISKILHTVQHTDTIESIVKLYGSSEELIKNANPKVKDWNNLPLELELQIPVEE